MSSHGAFPGHVICVMDYIHGTLERAVLGFRQTHMFDNHEGHSALYDVAVKGLTWRLNPLLHAILTNRLILL